MDVTCLHPKILQSQKQNAASVNETDAQNRKQAEMLRWTPLFSQIHKGHSESLSAISPA